MDRAGREVSRSPARTGEGGLSWVYFLRPVGAAGPVKIGSSRAPTSRLATYAQWAPWPLEIAAQIPGDCQTEARFHARFAHVHTHHEWFGIDAELTACIDAINAGHFDVETLPPPKRIRTARAARTLRSKENTSLRLKLTAKTYKIGLRAPEAVEAARKDLDSLDDSVRDAAIARIEGYLEDPIRFGRLVPYPWAQTALNWYLTRHPQPAPQDRAA